MGIKCVQCIRTDSAAHEGLQYSVVDPGSEKRGAHRVLVPKIFWVHFSQFGALFKELAKIGGGGGACCHCVSFILPIYVQTLALRWAWRTFYVPAGGGGGCERTQRAPPQPTALHCNKLMRPRDGNQYCVIYTQMNHCGVNNLVRDL